MWWGPGGDKAFLCLLKWTFSNGFLYIFAAEERYEPLIWILDSSYQYSNEFYGTSTGVALTPMTERCFLTMSQALQKYQGSCVSGPVGVGKTETVKVNIYK